MNWNDPNWVGALGQWVGAIASFLAVVTAVGIALYSGRQARKQIKSSVLPRLVIDNGGTTIWQERNELYLNWEAKYLIANMQNVGLGTAFNIVSVIYGSKSYPGEIGKPRIPGNERHWTFWGGSFMQPGAEKSQQYNLGGSTYYENNQWIKDKKKRYRLQAPDIPDFQMKNPQPRYIARITTTYQDIYGRKHASIFDADDIGRLKQVDFLENIDKDLRDLEG